MMALIMARTTTKAQTMTMSATPVVTQRPMRDLFRASAQMVSR